MATKDGGKDGGKSSKKGQPEPPPPPPPKQEEVPWVPRKTDPNVFDFAPLPEDPNMYLEDDAVRFHRPADQKSKDKEANEERESESRGPKPTDWRWGPAQYWCV